MGVQRNCDALRAGQSGLDSVSLFKTNHRVPVGEVKLSNGALKTRLGLPENATFSRTALLGMLAAKEAIDDAQIAANQRVGLVSATSVGGMDLTECFYRDFMHDPNKGRLRLAAHHDSADSTLQIANYCGIHDFSTTISTACSSAANAIMLGARLLRAGLLDVVVAGGRCALPIHAQRLQIADDFGRKLLPTIRRHARWTQSGRGRRFRRAATRRKLISKELRLFAWFCEYQ